MIREYEHKELDAIMGIWLDSNIKAHDFIPASYWARNLALVKLRYIPASTTFVYEEEGELKGFISVMDDTFVGALFVAHACQGQGIGRALMEHVQKRSDTLSLKVYAKNKKAVAFYEKMNFGIDETQTDPDTQEEEYLMSWNSERWLELFSMMMC